MLSTWLLELELIHGCGWTIKGNSNIQRINLCPDFLIKNLNEVSKVKVYGTKAFCNFNFFILLLFFIIPGKKVAGLFSAI